MPSQADIIAEALKAVLAEPAPNSHDALLDELRKHERLIRQTIDRGWTPTRLASRLKAAGVKGRSIVSEMLSPSLPESPRPARVKNSNKKSHPSPDDLFRRI